MYPMADHSVSITGDEAAGRGESALRSREVRRRGIVNTDGDVCRLVI